MEVSSNFKTLPFIFKERIDIDVTDYSSNSDKSKMQVKTEPEKMAPVISQPVKLKKRDQMSLFNIIFEQDFKDIKEDLFKNRIRPKLKDIAYNMCISVIDTIDAALQMMIFKDSVISPDRRKGFGDRVSYNKMSDRRQAPSAPSMSTVYNYDDVIFNTRDDAITVLDTMQQYLKSYPSVSVARFYEFANAPTTNWASNNYGWTNLDSVEVKRCDEGWVIDFPKAKLLT